MPSSRQLYRVSCFATAKDWTAWDRSQLNEHVFDIVGKADFNRDDVIGEVERALFKAD